MIKRLLLLSCFFILGLTADVWSAAAPLNVSVDHGVSLNLSGSASSVFIANPDIADVQVMSPTSIMIFGKKTGETTFMATDSSGHTLAQRTVVVMQDLSNLRQELDSAIPGNKIQVQPLPGGIVLTGEAKDAAAVADSYRLAQRYLSAGGDIINRIKVVGSNQIHIRVRFAEVQRNIDNTLGFNWQNMNNVGGFAIGLATGGSTGAALLDSKLNIGNVLDSNNSGTDVNSILRNRPNNTTLNLRNDLLTIQHGSVNGLIDALAQDGLINILAEPNLTAMSGETASFLAGGEFPIPIPQGNGTISIEFKKYGISLEFTPTLITDNRINLHVKPEVSELTQVGAIVSDNITVPALTTRKAETTVELASGDSFAIAGLLDNNQAHTVNKFPLLGDLPIIGALFRSDHFVNGQTELVVIITPYVVTPSKEQLALPMDGFSPPTEKQRLLGLRYSNSDPDARPMSGQPVGQAVNPPPVPAPMPMPVPESDAAPVIMPPASVASENNPPPPLAAPVTPVALSPKIADPVSLRPSTTAGSLNAPAGPGGFLVE